MGKTISTIVFAVLLTAVVVWLVWQGQEQAEQLGRLDETAKANAAAVQEQKEWAGNVDKALGDWRVQRDAQDKKTAELRKQLEAARHDEAFTAWADRPLPDAAVRLLQAGAAH